MGGPGNSVASLGDYQQAYDLYTQALAIAAFGVLAEGARVISSATWGNAYL